MIGDTSEETLNNNTAKNTPNVHQREHLRKNWVNCISPHLAPEMSVNGHKIDELQAAHNFKERINAIYEDLLMNPQRDITLILSAISEFIGSEVFNFKQIDQLQYNNPMVVQELRQIII